MFVELYKTASKSKYAEIAFNCLVKDKLEAVFSHANTSRELSAMNMESELSGVSFIPSMFYTFSYESKMQDKMARQTFYDLVPVVLCMSNSGSLMSGLNFNFIPTDIRAVILDTIYNAYESFYTVSLDKGEMINDSFASVLMQDAGRGFVGLLDSKLQAKISYAYRTYTISEIKNARLIEYDQWKYIPFLTFDDAVRGASLAKLQKDIADTVGR